MTVFSRAVLALDCAHEITRISAWLAEGVRGTLKRRGAVVGISGGIDSAVVAALAVAALGPERVFGLFMPERDSADESLALGQRLAKALGIETAVHDIAPTLTSLGCYARQREAVQRLFPDYDEGWRHKLSLPPLLDGDRLNVMQLTVQSPTGAQHTRRMTAQAYAELVAATNFKQRVRKTVEYYHADRLGYAVLGTPNRLEYDQGFFVKQGDGAADLKPIAHLYKTQVYALGAALGVPAEILRRPPTTDTYSLPQTQEEFYFALPYHEMDLCLYAVNHAVPAHAVAPVLGLGVEQVERVFKDIAAKRRVAAYLGRPPLLLDEG